MNALINDHEQISAYVYVKFKNLESLKGFKKKTKQIIRRLRCVTFQKSEGLTYAVTEA